MEHNEYVEQEARHIEYIQREPTFQSDYYDWQPTSHNNFFDEDPFFQNLYYGWQPSASMCNEYFNQQPTIKEATTSTDPLIYEIPNFFRPYVTRINDVEGDGNCGFRAIAVGLGRNENEWPNIRRELLHELTTRWEKYRGVFGIEMDHLHETLNFLGKGFAPFRHWMLVPETCFLVAERYKCIVHFISKNQSYTCFPLFTSPPTSQEYPEFRIANVNSNHYVHLEMQEGHPLPETNPYWNHFKDQCADGWEELYSNRINMYSQSIRPNSRTDFVDLDEC